MNFQWGSPGSRDYAKAQVAYAVKGKPRDWAAIKTYAEAALAKDAAHLGAHWLLAAALAQLGEYPAVVDHLTTAIAADYFKYGVALGTSKDLEPFLGTPHGKSVTELAAKIHDDYKQRIPRAVFVIGRRSPFRWPDRTNPHESSSRGELYAYDRDTRQYLRLTHTNDTVVGYVRPATGGEIAVLAYDRMDRAKPDDPPLISRTFVQLFDADMKAGPKATIEDPAREIGLGYGPGDNLLVTTAPANGRWGTGEIAVSSFDKATGKLTRNTVAPPVPRIVFSLEEGHSVRMPEGVKAAWTGEPPTAPGLEVGGKAISIPESGNVAQSSVASTQTHVAFATAVDPCAKDAVPSLHVADLATGRQLHLLTARSHFATSWIDPTTLVYEDGEGQIRMWDATTARQLPNPLVNKPGLALAVLSLEPGPLCKQGGNVEAGSGSGGSGSDEPPLPPED